MVSNIENICVLSFSNKNIHYHRASPKFFNVLCKSVTSSLQKRKYHKIGSKRTIIYLGLIIDDRLNFKEHMKYIGKKTSVTQGAVKRMMPNIKRRIISIVVMPIILYACPIWSEALSVATKIMKLCVSSKSV